MTEYVLNDVVTCRVATVEDALALRKELEQNLLGELISFTYTNKFDKKNEEEYVVVKAKIEFNKEKEIERKITIDYEEA